MIIPFARRRFPAVVALAAAALTIGTAAAIHYQRVDLTLSHYDARGHLVVARRIIDSITPGWQQIGAVWLPLPHLLNMLPVQIDLFYRTGWSAVAISVLSFAIASASIAWIVLRITGSSVAAAAGTMVFIANPNVLYLQATPMTEPLLFATMTTAVAALIDEASDPGRADERRRPAGILFALTCLTRYEAWPVTAVALSLAVWALWRQQVPLRDAVRRTMATATYPAIAIAGFALFSRIVIGQWFVANDFFVPENQALGSVILSARQVGWGLRALSAGVLAWIAAIGLASAAATGLVDRRRSSAVIVVSLLAAAAVPLAAFYQGHPFRIRYMVPLIAAEAIGCGVAAGLVRRTRLAAALGVIAVAAATLRPFDAAAPMVVEAQWDRPNLPVRDRVTSCIGSLTAGAKVMASMGSLGHYMQRASADGFEIRDFLHEGNGDIWLAALERPRPFADWILIEEKAEGGDMLARIAREHPHFLDGYSRVCEGAGLALYKRVG